MDKEAILISIQPKWCELIADRKKTVEVRKTKPKLKPPFKCYIYCCKAPKGWIRLDKNVQLDTKVIGEFVCDRIDTIDIIDDPIMTYIRVNQLIQHPDICITAETCLNINQLQHYLNDKKGNGWHISDLKIYDEPKKLSEFTTKCKENCETGCYNCEYYQLEEYGVEYCGVDGFKPLKRPPQSWCYVEEVDNG